MVVQTAVQCNRQEGKADWRTIDFGPIVDICQVPTYVPIDGTPTRGCLWSTITTNSSYYKVSIYYIISVLLCIMPHFYT